MSNTFAIINNLNGVQYPFVFDKKEKAERVVKQLKKTWEAQGFYRCIINGNVHSVEYTIIEIN